MAHWKLPLFPFVLIGLLAALLVGTPLVEATSHVLASGCGSWRIVKSPNVGSTTNTLRGVAAVSASDIWAVGYYVKAGSQVEHTLIEHWNGIDWQVINSPNAGAYLNELVEVTARTANDIWAVGYSQSSFSSPFQTLIEHWNGMIWSIIPSPNVGDSDNLFGVAAASSGSVWSVGQYFPTASSASRTLVEHWNGTSWSIVTSPSVGISYNALSGVAVVSANNVWAVGHYDETSVSQTLTEQWDGTTWHVVKSPNRPADNEFAAVAPGSANTIWAVGNSVGGPGSFETLTEQWSGTSWRIMKSPNVMADFDYLFGVVAPAASDVWAVGTYGSLFGQSTSYTLIEHWNGRQWSLTTSPSPGNNSELTAVAATGGSVWAVGDSSGKTLIEFHC